MIWRWLLWARCGYCQRPMLGIGKRTCGSCRRFYKGLAFQVSVLLLLLVLPFASGLEQIVPASFVVNATSSTGLIEYPGGSLNLSGTVSQVVPFNLSFNLDGANETVELTPGENRIVSGRYDQLSLVCGTTGIIGQCGINATLGWGESYTRNDEFCSVRVKCDPRDAPANETYNVSSVVHISKDQDTLIFELDNRTERISLGVINASFDVPLTFFCPLTPFESLTEDQARITYDMCATYFPLVNDWLNLSLNRCFDNFDAYHEFVKTHDATIAASNQELSDCRAQNGRLEGENEEKRSELIFLNEQATARDADIDWMMALVAFLAICLFSSVVMNILQWQWSNEDR